MVLLAVGMVSIGMAAERLCSRRRRRREESGFAAGATSQSGRLFSLGGLSDGIGRYAAVAAGATLLSVGFGWYWYWL